MMELQVFGPGFGLPEMGPFCTKAMVLLQMSGLPHRVLRCDLRRAPKGKAPWLVDGDDCVADSTFIRWHLEARHGIDFDAGLPPVQRGCAWAVEKLCEDHLYWALIHERWAVDHNFDRGPRHFFDSLPLPLRPVVSAAVRRKLRRDLLGQGFGRHSREEILRLGERALDAVAEVIGDSPYLMGGQPCGADASVFGMLAGVMSETFDTPLREHAAARPELLAYRDRCMQHWFPDFSG